MKIRENPGQWPHTLVLLLALLLVLCVAIVDRYADEDISAYVFYSIPICLATWLLGFGYGVFVAVCSSAAWFLIDFKESYETHRSLLLWNALIRTLFFVAISRILSSLKSAYERETSMAHHDYLTGVANRRTFFERGTLELKRAARTGHPFTFAFVDLDNFKAINDTRGHQEGDELLCLVARTLSKGVRATDLVARLGGDEFVILLPDTDPGSAVKVLEKLQGEIHQSIKSHDWKASCSIGATTCLTPPGSVDELIQHADALLLAAKQSGKSLIKHEFLGKK